MHTWVIADGAAAPIWGNCWTGRGSFRNRRADLISSSTVQMKPFDLLVPCMRLFEGVIALPGISIAWRKESNGNNHIRRRLYAGAISLFARKI